MSASLELALADFMTEQFGGPHGTAEEERIAKAFRNCFFLGVKSGQASLIAAANAHGYKVSRPTPDCRPQYGRAIFISDLEKLRVRG